GAPSASSGWVSRRIHPPQEGVVRSPFPVPPLSRPSPPYDSCGDFFTDDIRRFIAAAQSRPTLVDVPARPAIHPGATRSFPSAHPPKPSPRRRPSQAPSPSPPLASVFP